MLAEGGEVSNTEDAYREQDAKRKGHVEGLYGEPNVNPYKPSTGTWLAWDTGWRDGHKRHLKMKTRRVRASVIGGEGR